MARLTRGLVASLTGPVGGDQGEAWRRAEELLAASLTPAQYDSYLRSGYVEIASRLHEGRTYRVDGWRPVAVHDEGGFVGAVCIRAREHLPAPDVLLARKLMIEGAEEEFLRAGNWLQPAWRPAGAAPSLFLVLALLSPWLLHLRVFGAWGFFAAAAILGFAAVAIARRSTVPGWDGRPDSR